MADKKNASAQPQPATNQQTPPPGHAAPSGQPNGKQSFSTVDAEGREIPPSDTPEPATIAPAVVPRQPATAEPASGPYIPQSTTRSITASGPEAPTTAPGVQPPSKPGSTPSSSPSILYNTTESTTSTASSGGTITPSTGRGTHTTNGVTAPPVGHGNLIPENTTHPEHIDLANRRTENLEKIARKRPLNPHEQEVYDNARRVRDRNSPAQPGDRTSPPPPAGSSNTGNPDDLAMSGDEDALVPVTPDGEDATLDAAADTPPAPPLLSPRKPSARRSTAPAQRIPMRPQHPQGLLHLRLWHAQPQFQRAYKPLHLPQQSRPAEIQSPQPPPQARRQLYQ